MNARFCCSTPSQSWQELIWTTVAMFSSESACKSPHAEKTRTNTKAVIPIIIRISFSPSLVDFHFNQDCHFEILIGSIIHSKRFL
jgi:hypothetical protein